MYLKGFICMPSVKPSSTSSSCKMNTPNQFLLQKIGNCFFPSTQFSFLITCWKPKASFSLHIALPSKHTYRRCECPLVTANGPLHGCTSAFFRIERFSKMSLCWLIKTMHDAFLSELWGSSGFVSQKPQIPLPGIPATQAVHKTLTEIIILNFTPMYKCMRLTFTRTC